MTEEPTDLDKYRGMSAQKETELRRGRQDVQSDEMQRRALQEELERFLAATPAISWVEAAEKMRFLLGVFSLTPEGMDPRWRRLIDSLLQDMDRLLAVDDAFGDNDNV